MRIAVAVINNEWLTMLILGTLMFSWIGLSYRLRGRAMRALAARFGYVYLGPPTPRLVFFYMPKVKPRLPFTRAWFPANEIRQAWNLIEGQEGGLRLVIFDSFIWSLGSNGQYITFLACETEQNPFRIEIDSDSAFARFRVTQTHGWTILYEVPRFLMNPFTTWGMGIQNVEHELNKLRTGALLGDLNHSSKPTHAKSDSQH